MLEKKSSKGDLEGKKKTFMLLGLVAILTLTYAGFELFANQAEKAMLPTGEDEFVLVDIDVRATDVTPPKPQVEPPREAIIRIIEGEIHTIDIGDLFNVEGEIIPENNDPYTPIDIIPESADLPPPEPFVSEMPEFEGGNDALYAFLKANLVYPEFARMNGIQGIVLVEFIVERDGSISNIKILNSVSLDCDQEAIRVVKKMPKWKVGKNKGKAARVFWQLPIIFSLTK